MEHRICYPKKNLKQEGKNYNWPADSYDENEKQKVIQILPINIGYHDIGRLHLARGHVQHETRL